MLNVSMRQLRSLLAIHATGKISTAANELGLTGPAITQQLRQLEDEVGLTLFDRTSEGLRPTAAGLCMIDAARSIHDRLRLLREELELIAGARAGTLRLGVVSTAKYFAPRMIAAFLKRHPGIRVDMFVGNRDETIEALRTHSVDMALMGRPPRDFPVRSAIFGDHPFVVIAPADHPLVGRVDISRETIARERFLVREPGSGTRTSLELYFAGIPGKLEDIGAELNSNETIKQAVMAGLGIAFLSAHTIELELEMGRLAILDVEGMPIRRQWFLVSRQDRTLTPTMDAFGMFMTLDGPRFLPVTPKTYPEAAVMAHDARQSGRTSTA